MRTISASKTRILKTNTGVSIMGARKIEKFPIQTLSLDAIKADHAIQSRVATSMEYQREFSEAMLRGDVFPPVTVFFDGNLYWLADGFHRYGAAKQAAKANPVPKGSIRAEVREGTRRDAMVFSAGANIKFSIPRTHEDIKKAVWMLLDDEEWVSKANSIISRYCGVHASTVQKYRAAFCESRGKSLPDVVETESGNLRVARVGRGGSKNPHLGSFVRQRDGKIEYIACVRNRQVYLGRDKDAAERKLKELLGEVSEQRAKLNRGLYRWLPLRGVVPHPLYMSNSTYPAIFGFTIGSFVCTWEDFADSGNAVAAVGRVLLLKQCVVAQTCPTVERYQIEVVGDIKPIVVCYPEDGPAEILALGRQLGVEFLTPEELVARVKEAGGGEEGSS